MDITREWLEDRGACFMGMLWFDEHYPGEAVDRNDLLKELEKQGQFEYYDWLLSRTAVLCPLPEGWKFPDNTLWLTVIGDTFPEGSQLPEKLRQLYLNKGARLPEGTQLPSGLWYLNLFGSVLPADITLPEGLEVLEGGTLAEGVVLPKSLRQLNAGAPLPPGLVLPLGLVSLHLGLHDLTAGIEVPEGTRVMGGCPRY